LPVSCKLAAFSATYTPQTLEILEKRFGSKTVYLNAEDSEEHENQTHNKVPSNIKVFNLQVP